MASAQRHARAFMARAGLERPCSRRPSLATKTSRERSAIRRFDGHLSLVYSCAYSPDGSGILSASAPQTLREWDRSSGKEIRRFDGHSGSVTVCTYSPDGSRVLSASRDRTVREWDRSSGKEIHRFVGHSSLVSACAYSPDGSLVVSASYDNTLRIWAVADGGCLDVICGVASFECLAVSHRRLAAGDRLGNIWFLDCDWL